MNRALVVAIVVMLIGVASSFRSIDSEQSKEDRNCRHARNDANSSSNTSVRVSGFEAATNTAEFGEWIEASPQSCRIKSTVWKWLGTAPVCTATEGDCKEIGMEFERTGVHGSSCWTGNKILCKTVRWKLADHCNIMCDSEMFTISMHGTAPFCGASPCDCWKNGQIPITKTEQYECSCSDQSKCPDHLHYEGNAPCATGFKQLCATPLGFNLSYQHDRIDSCDDINHQQLEHQLQALKMVSALAKGGAKVVEAELRKIGVDTGSASEPEVALGVNVARDAPVLPSIQSSGVPQRQQASADSVERTVVQDDPFTDLAMAKDPFADTSTNPFDSNKPFGLDWPDSAVGSTIPHDVVHGSTERDSASTGTWH